MKIYQGLDIIEVERVRKVFSKYKEKFLKRIYTDREIEYCLSFKNKEERLSALFAGKEAVSKLLGTGIAQGVHWKLIEILHKKTGKPYVKLKGKALKVKNKKKIKEIEISLTHLKDTAAAVAVALAG